MDPLSGHIRRIISEPRDYQIALKDVALKQNTIAFLGTGSGKTFICVLLIKDMVADLLLKESQAPKLPMPDGPTVSLDSVFAKKTSKTFFFLVDRVPLVFQQAEVIEMHTDLRVGKFCGEMGVDFWDKKRWRNQLATYDVIVMTAQIMLNILRHGFLTLKEVALLVFDECHHALRSHPFNLIMNEFYFAPWTDINERPRVFGMTASPVKVGLNKTDSETYSSLIETLERNLDSKVSMLSEEMQKEIEKYVPRPKEFFVRFDPPPIVGQETEWVNEATARFPAAVMTEVELLRYELGEDAALDYLDRRLADLLIAPEREAQQTIHDQPPIGQQTADLLAQQGEVPLHVDTPMRKTEAPASAIIAFRERLAAYKASIEVLITPKFRKLEALLMETARGCSAVAGFRALVFVDRRFLAKSMYLLLCKSEQLTKAGVTAGLIVGHGNPTAANPLTDDVKMDFGAQNEALNQFRIGRTNVLVCTSVVEEGLDVPDCELVVLFDGVSSMTGYVQSRGRARHAESKYVVFVQAGSDDEYQLRTAHVGEQLMESTVTKLREKDEEEEEEEDEPQRNWGNVFRIVSTGAIATHLSAMEQLRRYTTHLPHDIFYSSKPLIDVEYDPEQEKRCRGRVTLPATAAVAQMYGEWTQGKRRAIQSAVLHTVVALYEANALNDHLLPNIALKNNAKYRARLRKGGVYAEDKHLFKPDDKAESPYFRLLHGVASILRDAPMFDVGVSIMHIYKLEMLKELPPDPSDRQLCDSDAEWGSLGVVVPLAPIGIVLRETLKHIPPPFMHYTRPYGRLMSVWSYVGPVSLTQEQYGHAFEFQKNWSVVGLCKYWVKHQDRLVDHVEVEEEELIDDHEPVPTGPILSDKPPLAISMTKSGVVPAVVHTDEAAEANSYWDAITEPLAQTEYRKRHGKRIKIVKTQASAVRVPKSYLILPLDRTSDTIDWDQVESIMDAVSSPPTPVNQEWATWQDAPRQYGDEDLDEFMAMTGHPISVLPTGLRSLVASKKVSPVVPHRILQVRWDITPAAPFQADVGGPFSDETFADQSGSVSPQQPLLEVTAMPQRPPDLHRPIYLALDIEAEECVLPTRSLLVPESSDFYQVPASIGLQEAALSIPSVLTDFERWALVEELRVSVGSDVGDTLLVKALTSAASHSTENYEKLEAFGDTVLKFIVSLHVFLSHPSKHQGNLTVLKELLITNQSLVSTVLRRNLAPFLSVLPQRSSSWTPGSCTTHKVTVKSKTLADSLEALIGAMYLGKENRESDVLNFRRPFNPHRQANHTGDRPAKRAKVQQPTSPISTSLDGVTHFLVWAGILPSEDETVTITDYVSQHVLHPPYPPRLQKLLILLEPVQDIIGYRFKNPALLVEAFLHGSVHDAPVQCYQRLEFLGDAVLDLFMVLHLWFEYEDIGPVEMTEMKQNLCTNEHFARVVGEIGLHRFILHHSPPLMSSITNALHQLNDIKKRESDGETVDLFEITAPKVMGDVLESLAGAILLDGGIDVFFDVFAKLLKPHMIPADHIALAPLRRVARRCARLGERSKFEVLAHEECADNRNHVVVGMYFKDRLIATGEARNKRLARRMAAINSLKVESWGDDTDLPIAPDADVLGGVQVRRTEADSIEVKPGGGSMLHILTQGHENRQDDEGSGWDL